MPATRTAVNACGVGIEITDELGEFRNISGSANEANLDFDNTLGDYKAFGDPNTYRLECGQDATLELTIFYSKGTLEAVKLLRRWKQNRGNRKIRLAVPKYQPGADRYAGEFKIEKLSIPLKSDEAKPIAVKATLRPDGDIMFDTIPGA